MPTLISTTPRVRDVLIYGSLIAIGPLTIDMYLAGLPTIVHDLRTSDVIAGLTLTATMAGIATGQLIIGAVSDQIGRRRPLLVALTCYIAISLGLSLAPNIWSLLVLRFFQGLAAASGIVLSQAMVRDRFSGAAMAKFMARLMLVTGVAPILAPWIGAQFLHFGTWRTIFLGLAGAGVAMLATAFFGSPETLPAQRRRTGGLAGAFASYRYLLTNRKFIGCLLTGSLGFGTLFVYVSSAPFLYQHLYGMSPQQYATAFAAGAVTLIIGTQLNGFLVDRVHPAKLLAAGIVAAFASVVFLLACGLLGAGVVGTIAGIMLTMGCLGLVMPNNMVLALADHGARAGSAAALLAATNFGVGALVAAMAGVLEGASPVPMALLMLVCVTGSAGAYVFLVRPREVLAAMRWPDAEEIPGEAAAAHAARFHQAVEELLRVSREYECEVLAR